jgi:hypothetical protein
MPDELKPVEAGMMRVWDPVQKKVIFVTAEPAGDSLTLTVRLHDPKEKKDPKLSASWAVAQVPRADLKMAPVDFAAKHVLPLVEQLEHLKKEAI